MGRGFVVKTFIHLVGQDPGARLAAVIQDGLLLCTRERPAGRVVGRVEHQQTGGG